VGVKGGSAGIGTAWQDSKLEGILEHEALGLDWGEGLEFAFEVRFLPILFLPCCECVCSLVGNACFILGKGRHALKFP
jgi:hypothetical protein